MKHMIFPFFCLFLMSCAQPKQFTTVTTDTQKFQAEIAHTPKTRMQGLMNQSELAPNNGMLFIFKETQKHGFWMKNTLIPLDIIWISSDKKIVDIQTVQPCTTEECPSYIPKNEAQYVLEVNANTFKAQIGDTVFWD